MHTYGHDTHKKETFNQQSEWKEMRNKKIRIISSEARRRKKLRRKLKITTEKDYALQDSQAWMLFI